MLCYVMLCYVMLVWTGQDRTGQDSTGLDWTGMSVGLTRLDTASHIRFILQCIAVGLLKHN